VIAARPGAPPDLAPMRPVLPLHGLTVLAVEDSRFASDALRLICQRSGARLRRAESIAAARAHLRLYRPDVVLVDMGLPDGRGETLIRWLALQSGPRPVILGMSGEEGTRTAALAAGAADFLAKPFAGVAAVQAALLAHLPDRWLHRPWGGEGEVRGDPIALRDDLVRAAQLAAHDPDAAGRQYLAGFLGGLARMTGDAGLAEAARGAASGEGIGHLQGVLAERVRGVAPI
jgi:CheY-like chemotaxis protein